MKGNKIIQPSISQIESIGFGFKELEIIDSTTKSKLADKPAYKYIYEMKKKGDYFKYLEIGTIIDENQVLFINFKAPLLPV